MPRLKKLILFLLIIYVKSSSAILFSILKDLFIGVEILTEINNANRQALMTGVRNIMSGQNNPLFSPDDDKNKQEDDDYTIEKKMAGKLPTDVVEILDFLKFPEKFRQMGVKPPKGFLMHGPPGTGKTLCARCIAYECNAEFIDAKGSEFVEMYVGVGPKRVRELFEQAVQKVKYGPKKKAIIFIDELDGVGAKRAQNHSGGEQEYNNTLNELLAQLDGFKINDSIFIIGATNRIESLDPALIRPGRFDRLVKIELPDKESRLDIIIHYCNELKYDRSIDLSKYAELTNGWSPAELMHAVKEAGIKAVRENSDKTYAKHLDQAFNDGRSRKRLTNKI